MLWTGAAGGCAPPLHRCIHIQVQVQTRRPSNLDRHSWIPGNCGPICHYPAVKRMHAVSSQSPSMGLELPLGLQYFQRQKCKHLPLHVGTRKEVYRQLKDLSSCRHACTQEGFRLRTHSADVLHRCQKSSGFRVALDGTARTARTEGHTLIGPEGFIFNPHKP